LYEEVYMELPPGFYDKNESKVCNLVKSLYGLNKLQCRGMEITTALVKNGFVQSKNDYALYIKSKNGLFIALLVYVDDIQNVVLSHVESEKDKYLPCMTEYKKIVGKLIYLSVTRPDISYAVHCLSQHMHAPLQSHLIAALKVFRYLKNAPVFSLIKVFSTWMVFGGNTHDLSSFGEVTDKIMDLHQIHEEALFKERGDGVTGIKRRHRDLSGDGVRDLLTASGRGRLKEDLESST
ncbi:ribonuclease H-like domain-containing protein, partial [Tanacetum coccineum]